MTASNDWGGRNCPPWNCFPVRPPTNKGGRSLLRVLLVATLLTVLVVACGTDSPPTDVGTNLAATATPDVASQPTPTLEPTTAIGPSTTLAPDVTYPEGILPVRLKIPTLGIDTDTIELQLSGPEPEVPEDFDQAGWYRETRLPGEIGPAVIAGHIDSKSGPAVFAKLNELQPGDAIFVAGEDGTTVEFEVVRSGQYPKGDLPTEVFGFDLPVPELRLITCGGTFNRQTGHYDDNYVVYALAA